MLNKYSWLVIVEVFDGKRFASAHRVSNSENLLSKLEGFKSAESVNIADSKKAAVDLADYWNECYRKNGTLYDWMTRK